MKTLPLQLSQASGVPFYRQIEDQIAELIRAGTLRPGEQIPSVRELAAQTLVSLITVRRAYSDLAAEGLIVQRRGQGSFVSQDVLALSRDRALAEGRQILTDAVYRATQLGLGAEEILSHVTALISTTDEGATDGE